MGVFQKKSQVVADSISDSESEKYITGELLTERLFTARQVRATSSRRESLIIDVEPTLINLDQPAQHARFVPVETGQKEAPDDRDTLSSSEVSNEAPTIQSKPHIAVIPNASSPQANPVVPPAKSDIAQDNELGPEDEASKKTPTANTARRIGASKSELCLLVETSINKRTYWNVTAKGAFMTLSSPPSNCPLISISALDSRFPVPAELPDKQAVLGAAERLLEPASVINRSSDCGIIYATPASRLQDLTSKVIPGIALLDALLNAHHNQMEIFGWKLQSDSGAVQLLALYHKTASGTLHGPSIKIMPADVDFEIEQYKARNRLPAEPVIRLFGLNELLRVSEDTRFKYSKRRSQLSMAKYIAWFVLLAVSALFAVSAYRQTLSAQNSQDMIRSKIHVQTHRIHVPG